MLILKGGVDDAELWQDCEEDWLYDAPFWTGWWSSLDTRCLRQQTTWPPPICAGCSLHGLQDWSQGSCSAHDECYLHPDCTKEFLDSPSSFPAQTLALSSQRRTVLWFTSSPTTVAHVSFHCVSHRFKTANIKILSANSTHRRQLSHLYQSVACHKYASNLRQNFDIWRFKALTFTTKINSDRL